MNNTQVAVLASSMRTGGRNMNSVQDMLEDSKLIEAYLDEQDAIKERTAARDRALAAYSEAEGQPLHSWEAFKATPLKAPERFRQTSTQAAADANGPGSFEALVPPALRGAH